VFHNDGLASDNFELTLSRPFSDLELNGSGLVDSARSSVVAVFGGVVDATVKRVSSVSSE
jgi:hypothetical protein